MIKRVNKKVLLLILGFHIMLSGYSQEKVDFKSIRPTKFYVLLNDRPNAILIDACDLKAFKSIIIEGSINLENREQLKSFSDTLDRETPILVYCDVGSRGKQACKILIEMGFVEVYNLKGGIYKWQANNYPVIEYK